MWTSILAKLEHHKRLDLSEAAAIWDELPLLELGQWADRARRLRADPEAATYVVDRNINYTNVCSSRCRFCAFYRDAGAPDAYVLDREEIFRKIEETLAAGGSGILMQGGLHPALDVRYFEELLRSIRQRYMLNLHCFSPPEIIHLSRISAIGVEECLRRLVAAGLTSLPGGGAEILSDEVRNRISPRKCSSGEWLHVMETAHRIGLKTTATMMFGCGETLRQRLQHLDLLRSLQDRHGGFVAFIPWTFQWPKTELGREGWPEATAVEYLRWLALGRLFLDNFPTIQSSWVTQGLKIAQVALAFGANDIGSVMLEENVVAATGVSHRTSEAELRRLIADAGFRPVRRDSVHRHLE